MNLFRLTLLSGGDGFGDSFSITFSWMEILINRCNRLASSGVRNVCV